jgi:hypothetical protein
MLVFSFMKHVMAGSVLGLVLAMTLFGCGREPASDNAQVAATPATAAKSPASDAALKGMVSGVSAGKDESIELKFELKDRPQLGQPLTISIALLPKVSANTMRVTYISTDALAVQPGAAPAEYRDIQSGSVYRHELSVVPRDNGVYYVSAVVLLDTDSASIARTFAIPVVVGAPADRAATTEPKTTTDSER